MVKNYLKTLGAAFFLLFIFGLPFGYNVSSLTLNKAFAADLEVNYPIISGQTLTTNTTLPDYVKYWFNAGMFIGFFAAFISLIIAGVLYFLSVAKPDLLTEAKDRVYGAISGTLLLALVYLIITTINPQLSFLNLNKPAASNQINSAPKPSGVSFYKTQGCSDKNVQFNTSSISDLGYVINSVGLQDNATDKTSYLSILYSNPGFLGECQYIDPNKTCQNVSAFAKSASVYKYDNNPDGDGVYFYRNSCFNDSFPNNIKDNQIYGNFNAIVSYCNLNSGGYYKITNSQIMGSKIYEADLNSLKFTNVPADQENCTKYNANGLCAKNSRTAPPLSGGNISSIIINGNYIVLLVYRGPADSVSGPWTFCQEFPTASDTNRLGPRQIKWENIINSNKGVIPNYVLVIPVQED